MRKLKAFAIALLLSTLTASAATAQAGEDKVTKKDSLILSDVFYMVLGGGLAETKDSVKARIKQAKPGEKAFRQDFYIIEGVDIDNDISNEGN